MTLTTLRKQLLTFQNMTRFLHDQFAKDYLEKLLQSYGELQVPRRVSAEVREIDIFFAPTPTTTEQLETLGLLGRIAALPAILEPFRNAASSEEICDCLLKLLQIKENCGEKPSATTSL